MADNKIFFSLIIIILQINLIALVQYQEERIINSTQAEIEDYPFIVSIQWYKYHLCGGVIISHQYILTSAKCIHTFGKDELKILAGTTYRNDFISADSQERDISNIINHDNFEPITWKYDIAILELSEALLESNTVKPIGFYEGVDPVDQRTDLTVLGWGVFTQGASFYPMELHMKNMRSYDINSCIEELEHQEGYIVHQESMFCAKSFYIPNDHSAVGGICNGDFGGPLVTTAVMEIIEMKLVGLASRSFACDNTFPNMFTNLQKVRDFINKETELWPIYIN